jgi:AraC-like DNA-binding protein
MGVFLIVFVALHVLVYLALAIRQLVSKSFEQENELSFRQAFHQRWLRFIIGGLAAVCFLSILFVLFGPDYGYRAWGFLCILLSIFIYAMGYWGLRQSSLFIEMAPNQVPKEREATNQPRYAKSTLTAEMAADCINKLEDVMINEKPYLENELTLQQLASSLAISPHHLSQAINQKLNRNFYQLVNHYRIEEAKTMLLSKEHRHLNIAAVAFEVGFNSVSAFNTAFKKHARMTPSQFKKSHQA